MASKRSDIEAQIKALQDELAAADDDDDFEVEIFKDGKGARLPFRHSKDWLTHELGIQFPGAAPPAGDGGQGAPPAGAPPAGGKPAVRTRKRSDSSDSGGGLPDAVRNYFPGARS